MVGTAEYMSPEQWRGGSVGPAADVYSLGCVLYEALTGIAPFARKEADTEPEMPEGLDEVIERAVAKDPDDRYPSAGALIAAAREREGAGLAATRVLSEPAERPTAPLRARAGPQPRRRLRGNARCSWVGAGVAAGRRRWSCWCWPCCGGGGGSTSPTPIPVGGAPLRIAAAPDAIWVTSERDGTLTRLDPESGEPVGEPVRLGAGISGRRRRRPARSGSPTPAAASCCGRPASGRVLETIARRRRPRSDRLRRRPGLGRRRGRRRASPPSTPKAAASSGAAWPPHAAPLRLAVGAGGLWVSSATTGNVRRIDLSTLGVGAPIPVGRGPAGVTVAHGLVWVANSRSDTVTKVDPSIHAVLGDPIEVGGRPGGIDAGTSTVWVASAAEDAVTRIDLAERRARAAPRSRSAPNPAPSRWRRSGLGGQQRRRRRHPHRTLTRIGGRMAQDIDQLAINTIRTLSIDAVQKANSGHPGTPMSMAPVAYELWQNHLRYDPADPVWPNRDRFVLSAGHASMLLYSMLFLAGVQQGRRRLRRRSTSRPARCTRSKNSASCTRARPATPSTAGPPASRRPPGRSARGSRPRSGWRWPRSGRASASAPTSSTSTSTRSPATAA